MIEFDEHWVDESHRWTVTRVIGDTASTPALDGWRYGRRYELGTVEYHYGFEQWAFWPRDVIIPQDQMQAILAFMDRPKPTQEERDFYFSYKGDPLAR